MILLTTLNCGLCACVFVSLHVYTLVYILTMYNYISVDNMRDLVERDQEVKTAIN